MSDETAETGVSDERGRQQSFTQAAPNELKLGEGGVKWWELAIGLAVSSWGDEKGQED